MSYHFGILLLLGFVVNFNLKLFHILMLFVLLFWDFIAAWICCKFERMIVSDP